jgi:sulfur-oxidizing protein SoxY
MHTRRELMSHSAAVAAWLAAAGLLPTPVRAASPPAGAFEAKSIAELSKALGVAVPVESRDVAVTAPDIAENGTVVPIGISTSLPGVARLLLLVEKNPAILSAMFEVSDAVEANFLTRVKMGQSSNVYAVAMMKDGKLLFARKDVKVTLGGCAA